MENEVQCNISNSNDRKECGYYGIKDHECHTRGCCWSPLPRGQKGPWCYESPSKCLVSKNFSRILPILAIFVIKVLKIFENKWYTVYFIW